MGSTVKARPNHYEVLGLTPAASEQEIAQAFARGMSLFRPHTFGTLAELSVAYETLRDPVRRRAYDATLAPKPEPKPRLEGWHFVGSASAGPVVRPRIDPLHRPARQPDPSPPPEPAVDPRLAAIAASVRELAKKAESSSPATPEPQRPRPPEQINVPVHIEPPVAEQPFEWRRPALAIGGFVAVAGLVGALAGLSVKDEAQQPALSVALPAAKPHPNLVPSASVAPAAARPTEPELSFRAVNPVAETRRGPPAHRAKSWPQEVARQIQVADTAPAESQPDAAAADPLAPAPAAAPVAASMPLPNRVIARTIERIGYACGDVASTTAVEGALGTFKVTCTSGHSYQAAPVRGRYHFRRLSGR